MEASKISGCKTLRTLWILIRNVFRDFENHFFLHVSVSVFAKQLQLIKVSNGNYITCIYNFLTMSLQGLRCLLYAKICFICLTVFSIQLSVDWLVWHLYMYLNATVISQPAKSCHIICIWFLIFFQEYFWINSSNDKQINNLLSSNLWVTKLTFSLCIFGF